ncbi:MAG: hypothetical protein A2847_02420 [Candidatus Sungbacteria bacterium RIFCSPHIGHO2_01_FULL_50_25]|uniref:Rrf2 family transcriptional regulator n=1 Tax=Candidatus Sungbacteria bacterium RIFCSPHIGHO2_01_FULL_50_25 TaxID=1802265 RepID=A0A1G2KA96_9BACT|nr:MAG: hypothetical protein A2847_02420 [Candidatus Sungbacteria bacterium RIFCSPHIGHO2_01_FULL_50_25]
MKFSRRTDYGIILAQALRSTFRDRSHIPISKIAQNQGLPLVFLEKLAERLRQAGYLEARRGSEGGYRLVKDPKKITLKELIDVFEEPEMMRCMKSPHPQKHCAFVALCPTRGKWLEIEKRVDLIFESVTVDAL